MSQNDKPYEVIKEITRDQFITAWKAEEQDRQDLYTQKRIEEHEGYADLRYYIVQLTENGLTRLMLPEHVHSNRRITNGNERFWDIVDKYINQQVFPESCRSRITKIKDELNQHNADLLSSFYSLGRVFFDPRLADPNSDYVNDGSNLYTGNFHRFVAYGVWIKENEFIPAKVFLAKKG